MAIVNYKAFPIGSYGPFQDPPDPNFTFSAVVRHMLPVKDLKLQLNFGSAQHY
ncbi:hypothetical protein EYZ11_009899 [Aspergillus tanneri]|uniref:Uncharacterized protein n=1 Tax=Aspergillus tanneri TaxID=1220188 RepID=A0A4S3J8V5_9EURO|nr:hypothetical protein EYZ11_009899 [Aspergillus tanneri]